MNTYSASAAGTACVDFRFDFGDMLIAVSDNIRYPIIPAKQSFREWGCTYCGAINPAGCLRCTGCGGAKEIE